MRLRCLAYASSRQIQPQCASASCGCCTRDLFSWLHVHWFDLHALRETAQLAVEALARLGRDAAVHEFVIGLSFIDETLEVRVFIFHWEFVGKLLHFSIDLNHLQIDLIHDCMMGIEVHELFLFCDNGQQQVLIHLLSNYLQQIRIWRKGHFDHFAFFHILL